MTTRPKRPTRPKRQTGKRKSTGKASSGRWVRVSWWDTGTGYEMELNLRHLGVKVRDRKIHEQPDNGPWRLSIRVSEGELGWAQEIIFVQHGKALGMHPDKLVPSVARRLEAGKAMYEPKRRFSDKAIKSGGGPINVISEAILDFMGVALGPDDVRHAPADRRVANDTEMRNKHGK